MVGLKILLAPLNEPQFQMKFTHQKLLLQIQCAIIPKQKPFGAIEQKKGVSRDVLFLSREGHQSHPFLL